MSKIDLYKGDYLEVMNEFVVWEKSLGKFIDSRDMQIFGELIRFDGLNSNNVIFGRNEVQICNYIGLDDINNKKIYANCSIVEFEWKISGIKKGYFYYCNEDLCYKINCIEQHCTFELFYERTKMSNLKIIGTLQQNPELFKG